MKLKRKHILYLTISLLTLFFVCLFTKKAIQTKIEHKISHTSFRGSTVSYAEIQIKGFSTLCFSDLAIINPDADTLFKSSVLELEVSFLKLLSKQIDIKKIYIRDSHLSMRKDSLSCNYCFLLRPDNQQHAPTDTPDVSPDYSGQADKLAVTLFNLIPGNLELDNLNLSFLYFNDTIEAQISKASSMNNQFSILCAFRENSVHQNIQITGLIDKPNKKINGSISLPDSQSKLFTLPFTQLKYNALIQFESLDFNLEFPQSTKNMVVLNTDITCSGLHIRQPRIADALIVIPRIRAGIYATVRPDEIDITPNSFIQIDSIRIHPSVQLKKAGNWKIRIVVDEKMIPAQEFSEALPDGLFGPVKTVRPEGHFDYHFLLDLDLNNPDSLILESEVTPRNFRIVDPGVLTRMNNSFLYTAYEDGKAVKTFLVGSENPDFTTAGEVSPLLINAILQSEDGQFFYHNGFRIDAIREALIHDIKVQNFARGGSTISMQIVKNVFLDRNKNIARKLEEAMIVWLIESNHLTSKQRMFDVYLNIIEWGPGIYGVKDAAAFYFGKTPASLELDEAIYMASIIPRPKKYMWSFSPDGQLRESQYGHFRVVRDRLIRNHIIAADTTGEYTPVVTLKGPSLRSIQKNLPTVPDSLFTDSIKSVVFPY
ncbi:MAG: transglycosylase domain-containing protein [Bacteroidales bacterium]